MRIGTEGLCATTPASLISYQRVRLVTKFPAHRHTSSSLLAAIAGGKNSMELRSSERGTCLDYYFVYLMAFTTTTSMTTTTKL